jgi:hypothetical protein
MVAPVCVRLFDNVRRSTITVLASSLLVSHFALYTRIVYFFIELNILYVVHHKQLLAVGISSDT